MRTIKNLLFLVVLFTSQVVFGYDQSVTLKVGETKTISLPSEVTSKNIYAYNCFIDSPSYVELVGYTKTSVTVKGIKEYKYTVHVSYDFFYSEGSYNRSDTHTINIDVYEQGPGGGATGAGDDRWGDYNMDYGCWGTITVEKGREARVYSKYDIPSGYEGMVKCYKWSSNSSWFFSITNKNWNACTIKGDLAGSGPYSRLYCYMEFGSTSYQAYYDVVVTEPKKILVTTIALNYDNVDMCVGETQQLTTTVLPKNASDKNVVWSSDNVDVATVNPEGLVKGIGAGRATITCRATDGSGVSATCKVDVEKIDPTSISLPSEMSIGVGETVTLPYMLEPENASASITWDSEDQNIVAVSSSGEVTGVKEGVATVTATTDNGKSASCKVTVDKDLVRPIKITLPYSTNLEVGYATKLRYTLEPEHATTIVTWKSDDTDIATISSDGIVKGIKHGSARITATTANGLSSVIWVNVGGFKKGTTFYGTSSDDYDVTYRVTDINAKTCEVYDCDKNSKKIIIPASVQGYKVTSIGSQAFYDCGIESVILPGAVTTIGSYAFAYCKSLANISGINDVEYIGASAFRDTPWLASLPEGVNYIGKVLLTYKGTMPANTTIKVEEGCTQIAYSAFDHQKGLVGIVIPSSVKYISSSSIIYCESLRTIIVDSNNPIYDSRDDCNAIIKTEEEELIIGCVGTIIPRTIKSIGFQAFYANYDLLEINIPDNIDSIAQWAYTSVITAEKITIGKGLRVLGHRCFGRSSGKKSIMVSPDNPYFDSRDNCNAIIETKKNKLRFGCDITVIPGSVETIGEDAFVGSDLMMVIVPNSITGIEAQAFAGMDNLRSITIGRNVKSLGKFVLCYTDFDSSWGLTSIRSLIYFPTDIDKDVFCKYYGQEDSIYNHVTLYVPKGSRANYQSAAGWNRFKNVVEIDDDEMYNGMCFTEETVEGVELTYMITDAEKKECELVSSPTDVKDKVTIPSSVRGFTVCSIGKSVFGSRNALTEVVIPNTIESIGSSAFYRCSKIENLNLSSSLKSIGKFAFRGAGITSITIPKSVESIGSSILVECVNLQSITVEDGNPYYDSRNNCNGIFVKATNKLLAGCMSTIIPEETDTIGYDAFDAHVGYTETRLPDNLRTIEPYAFYRTGISTITIPESVDSIGIYSFRNCANLRSFKVLRKEPIRVKETVFFSETDTIYTFDQVTLYVPEGTKAKYQEADGWKRFKNIEEIVEQQDKKVTSITLSCAELSMAPGEKNQLAATVLPEDATDKTVSWTTDNAAVATVSEQGLVTAVGQGTATITCRANDGSGVYATCEVTVKKRASWAGKYLVSGQHVEATSVTKVYPDNFEMTIEEKNGGTYITSMFGNDLTTWNEGGFKLEMNDDGTASVNLANDNVLDYVSDTGLLYAMYVWDDETEDWCDTWSLRLNEDGTISLGEFYVAAFTWDETDETWRGRTEALYYDLLAVKDDGSAVHEIAQDQPGIHVRNGVIELDEAADVTVYKENGMIVYQGKTDRVDGLAKGMYIVCVGEQRKKVMIRK